jgi:hypothetical protein
MIGGNAVLHDAVNKCEHTCSRTQKATDLCKDSKKRLAENADDVMKLGKTFAI